LDKACKIKTGLMLGELENELKSTKRWIRRSGKRVKKNENTSVKVEALKSPLGRKSLGVPIRPDIPRLQKNDDKDVQETLL
ncbi:hypothetical protein, partial [Serratia marcescens]|uniref:hypothetical protein n=1 Tax=Serratia marcescens TaxID=615 RepID=UPI0028144CAD